MVKLNCDGVLSNATWREGVTTSVTGTTCLPPLPVSTTSPEYLPADKLSLVLTLTPTWAGVRQQSWTGETFSQSPSEDVTAEAVNSKSEPPLVTVMIWGRGSISPTALVK
jgi:hypothetical protein